jgi:hypothetical protein
MLAVSRGRLLALSTPFGKRGWFFNEWSEETGWQKHAITALQCTRIFREFPGRGTAVHVSDVVRCGVYV